jgi:hypothetical protein
MNNIYTKIAALITPLLVLLLLYQFFFFSTISQAREGVTGVVLLPEKNGEAWYIDPVDKKRFFLNRPSDALQIMREQGVGVTDSDLSRIPPSTSYLSGKDSDNDELPDEFEKAIGTDPKGSDTDGDGYNDKQELENGYDPNGEGGLNIDEDFAGKQQHRILLQTEKNGQAWYVADGERHFLGRPADAFEIMKNLSLGITEGTLNRISTDPSLSRESENEEENSIEEENGEKDDEEEENSCGCGCSDVCGPTTGADTAQEALTKASSAIRKGDGEEAVKYFTQDMEQPVTYTVDFLDEEGLYTLANTLDGAELSSSQGDKKIYTNRINFAGNEVDIDFEVEEQNEKWFMANL